MKDENLNFHRFINKATDRHKNQPSNKLRERSKKMQKFGHTGCLKKTAPLCFCLIFPVTSSLESWDISQMKGDIQRYVLSTISFLCDIGELRYWQNNTEQQNIEMVKYSLIPYSKSDILHCFVCISASRYCMENYL